MRKINGEPPKMPTATALRFQPPTHPADCFCEICKNNKAFDLPATVADSFIRGEVALVVGAGVSTEANGLLPNTFYEEIAHCIGKADSTFPFPEIMEEFCGSAESRAGLIQKIKSHFDYIYAHEELYDQATRFHRELATFFPIDTIITTNWDTYFEDECGATPFIEEQDVALWEAAERRVLKLHGSIANYGSIIATTSDYKKCAERLESGLIGARLKSLLSTRTTIFIGYSLKDDDFLQIYNAVREILADFHRPSFFVSPRLSEEEKSRLREMKLRLIETDGSFFISQMKSHARSNMCLASDAMYDRVALLLAKVTEAHHWLHANFNMHKYPQMVFCSWYQDGLMHSLKRILRLRRLGAYSDLHKLIHSHHSYAHYAKLYRRDKMYADAAYCCGYATGYLYARVSEDHPDADPPKFFYFDAEIVAKSEYKKAIKDLPRLHRSAFSYAEKVVSQFPKGSKVFPHHKDQLNLGRYTDT